MSSHREPGPERRRGLLRARRHREPRRRHRRREPTARPHARDEARARRSLREEPERVRGADETLRPATTHAHGDTSRPYSGGLHPEGRRGARLEHRCRGRNTGASTLSRHAADIRLEGRRPRRCADVRAEKGHRPRRGDARVNRASESAQEAHVDRPLAELGVEAADDEAARTGELPRGLATRVPVAAGTTTHGPAIGTHT